MNLNRFAHRLLLQLDPERAHQATIAALKCGLVRAPALPATPRLASEIWGLRFPHPIGLAAGFDKNAEVIHPMFRLGFGFVEVGTVTVKPQAGNPQPRIFRLEEDRAVINRLGFNNRGVGYYIASLQRAMPWPGVVGCNLGKNKDSGDAVEDYVTLFRQVYTLADYVTINVSSPNTVGLRALQNKEALDALLQALLETRATLALQHQHTCPILLKIAPDVTQEDMHDIAEVVLQRRIDGLIVSNTTITRPAQLRSVHKDESGGLSGAPLAPLALRTLRDMYRATEGRLPLIGVGGIASAQDAYQRIRAGASLLQLYTALIYGGPGLVHDIVLGLDQLLARDGFSHLRDAVGADIRLSN